MEKEMFCFQCEQTAGCTGCTGGRGVCGKTSGTASLQDELTGALIGLAHVADTNPPTDSTHQVVIEGLFTTLTNVNFDAEVHVQLLQESQKIKDSLREKVSASEGSSNLHDSDY